MSLHEDDIDYYDEDENVSDEESSEDGGDNDSTEDGELEIEEEEEEIEEEEEEGETTKEQKVNDILSNLGKKEKFLIRDAPKKTKYDETVCKLKFPDNSKSADSCIMESICERLDTDYKPFTKNYVKIQELTKEYNSRLCFKVNKGQIKEAEETLEKLNFISKKEIQKNNGIEKEYNQNVKKFAKGMVDLEKLSKGASSVVTTILSLTMESFKKIFGSTKKFIGRIVEGVVNLYNSFFHGKSNEEQQSNAKLMETQSFAIKSIISGITSVFSDDIFKTITKAVKGIVSYLGKFVKVVVDFVVNLFKWVFDYMIRNPTMANFWLSLIQELREYACEEFSMYLGYEETKQITYAENFEMELGKKVKSVKKVGDWLYKVGRSYLKEWAANGMYPIGQLLETNATMTIGFLFPATLPFIAPIKPVFDFLMNVLSRCFSRAITAIVSLEEYKENFEVLMDLLMGPCIRPILKYEISDKEDTESFLGKVQAISWHYGQKINPF